jgi:hypothetical protein
MKNWKGAILAIAITTVLLFVYFSPQIIGADHIAHGAWGDGYKNYYTLAYYLKYDSAAHFSGMNYPFGENVLFTDNQPAMAWVLKLIIKFFPGLLYHLHAFIAYGFFLSLVISAVLIYKIFTGFNMDPVNAALFSVLIVMLSPQIPRLNAHFSLCYSFYIPGVLYFLIRFFKSGGVFSYFLALLAFNTFFIFIHIYYGALSAMFILLVMLAYAFENRRKFKQSLRNIFLVACTAVFPFIFLKAFLLITDTIPDRPKAPWGFIMSRSTIADILLHPFTFTGEIIGQLFPGANIVYHGEGEGYIGLVVIVTLATAAILYFISSKNRRNAFAGLYPLNLFILPAIIVLLFAMAFPFNIGPFEKYYEKLPAVIKQFRASGRFNWIFYYNATILACLLIYQLFKSLLGKNKLLAYTTLVVVYAVWFVEVNMISNRREVQFVAYATEVDEIKSSKELLSAIKQAGKQVSDFQAIIPIPVFINGSEKLYIESGVIFDAMKASLFTGLPLVCGQMSRTSQSQTFKIANLFSGPLIKKDILNDYKNNKPLLLITHGNDLTSEERALVAKAKFLFADADNRYFQLDLSAFADSIGKTKEYFHANKSKFVEHGDYMSDNTTANVMLKRFENEPKNYAVFGKGAHYSEIEETYFYFDTLPNAKDSTNYEVSFWVYTDSRRAAYPPMYMTQIDATGKEVGKYECNVKFSTNTYADWVWGHINFTLYAKANKILLLGSGDYASFDEIMIRPQNVNVVTQLENDSTFIFNNFPIR